jgi:antitoxin (DNA-binding transcriptional repressor) of toxin-antitoxin stability system
LIVTSTTIEVRELPSRWAEVLSLAAAGMEIIVTEENVPRARLVPFPEVRPRVLGLHPGAFEPAADFDAPLPEEFWTGARC